MKRTIKCKTNLFYIVLLIFLNNPFSYASNTDASLGLNQLLSEKIDENSSLLLTEAQIEELHWKKRETYSGYIPSLLLTGNYSPHHKYLLTDINMGSGTSSIPAIVPTTQYILTAQWNIFNGMKTYYGSSSSKALESAAEKEKKWLEFKIKEEITLNYYKVISAQLLRDVAGINLRTLQNHQAEITKFKKAGIATDYDVLRVEVQLGEAQSELLNAEDNVETYKNKLAELFGHESESREISGTLPILTAEIISSPSLNKKINDLMETRYDLQALEDQVESAKSLQKAFKYSWLPQVNLFSQYQSYNNRNDSLNDSSAFRNAYLAGINLTWNLFDGFSTYSKYRSQLALKQQSEVKLKTSLIKSKQDFDFWKRKFLYFCSVFKSRKSDSEKATESVRLATAGLKVGARKNSDLLDAETDFYKSTAGVINAQMGAIEALIQLELVLGYKLYDFQKAE